MSAEQVDPTGLVPALRRMRDAAVDAVAKVTQQITSTDAYQRTSAALSQPGLIASAIARKAREKAMAQLLGQLNMPSRDEVLSISRRLTNIEMVLDDLSAAVEQVRARSAEPQRGAARPRARAAGGA